MPGIRLSEGRYLEILEAASALDVPIEVDVYDGATPATMLATLDGAFGKRFTRELSELGSGGFTVARTDPKATADILAIGNLVKFRVSGIYRHAIWIEEPASTVVSRGEEGGEDVAISGRGALAYLERAAVYPPVWPPAATWVVGSSSADNGSTGTTSLAVPKPAGAAAGDVAIVGILCVGAVPTTPPGWKRIRDVTEGTLRLALYVKRLLAAEPASTTWHWAVTTKASAAAVALRNASSDDPGWAISDTTGSGTAVELPSVSVNLVDGVLLTFAGSASSTSFAPGAGLTELVDRNATGRTIELAALENPALGDTGDLVATAGSSAAWIGLQVEIPSTAAADAVFTGATFGSVLATLITEAQLRGTIPNLTYDFDGVADSHGEPWPDQHDLAFHVGTSLLEVWRHLVTLGLEGGLTPDLRLQAYVDVSRHLEAAVILRKGHQLVGDVVDTEHGSGLRTRLLVEGAGGRILEVTDPTIEADARIGRREGYLSMSTSDNPTTLQRAGETSLASAAAEDQARSIAVVHGPASEGQFEPWVDYREGDWIGLDADGSGGVAVPQRVASITLEETEAGDFGVELELNSVEMDAFLRLQRRLDALSRDTTATGSGGASGGGGGAGGRVGATSSDTPGYLFDKIDVAPGLRKAIAGDVGVQRVRIEVNAPAIGSGTPDGTKFLRDDGAWAAPPGASTGAGATLVGVGSNTGGTSPLTITKPAGTADGDLLLFVAQTTNAVPNVLGPDGGGWTQILSFDTSSSEYQVAWFRIASGEGASWSLSHSAGSDCVAAVVVFRGLSALLGSALSVDSLATQPILGNPDGWHVCVWFSTTGATPSTDLAMPPYGLASAIFARNVSSTNKPQVLVGYRNSPGDGAVAAFVATGGAAAYNGALAIVFTS